MEKPEQGRVVVVTGASAGVGRATIRAFAREGARVGLIARDTEGLHAATREVDELGGKGLAAPADVAEADQVESAAARIESELGPIDVWVNNAMTTVFARVAWIRFAADAGSAVSGTAGQPVRTGSGGLRRSRSFR